MRRHAHRGLHCWMPAIYYLPLRETQAKALNTAAATVFPMFSGVVMSFLASPLVLATAWFCLRRYDPRTRLLAWRGDRPVRSVAATLVFGGAALVLTAGLLHDLILGVEPLHEYILVALPAPWIAWLLAMRAAREATQVQLNSWFGSGAFGGHANGLRNAVWEHAYAALGLADNF